MAYTLRPDGYVLRADGAIIPPDPRNADYVAYLAWLTSGNAPSTPAPEPAPLVRTYKSDVWRRCTDAEAARLDAALQAAPVRLRRLWDDCTILEHEAADFDELRDGMVAAFGEDRAAELLAAS